MPRELRQARLQQEPWVFACRCSRCDVPRPADALMTNAGSLDEFRTRAMEVEHGKLMYGKRTRNASWLAGCDKFLTEFAGAHVAHHQRHAVREQVIRYTMPSAPSADKP